MISVKLTVFCSQMLFVFMYRNPMEKKPWNIGCSRGEMVFNHCNWCVCKNSMYVCKDRDCGEIDKFGHFNEAIDSIHVGMEGHGVWRSQEECQPGISYRRRNILCICREDGAFSNAVCSDIFKGLTTMIPTNLTKPVDHVRCTPFNVYIIGCNVCVCTVEGSFFDSYCTAKICNRDKKKKDSDYDFLRSNGAPADKWEDPLEVYAECEADERYRLGCQSCKCLRNNRLICNKCPKTTSLEASSVSYCNKENDGIVFKSKCNICICRGDGNAYCTVRKCLDGSESSLNSRHNLDEKARRTVLRPVDELDCVVGTKYKKNCNTCVCLESENTKVISCTLNQCTSSRAELIHNNCVDGAQYEANCLLCHCSIENGVKSERCQESPKCVGDSSLPSIRSDDLDSLHGYCEPLQLYKKDCNTCRCLADGKTVSCTTRVCKKVTQADDRVNIAKELEIVPVKQSLGKECISGEIYRIKCNICYCLANGDALCTMKVCEEDS